MIVEDLTANPDMQDKRCRRESHLSQWLSIDSSETLEAGAIRPDLPAAMACELVFGFDLLKSINAMLVILGVARC